MPKRSRKPKGSGMWKQSGAGKGFRTPKQSGTQKHGTRKLYGMRKRFKMPERSGAGKLSGMRNSTLIRIIRALWKRYSAHNVGTESAALAFYLIFAIFPFLISISALLTFFKLSIAGALRMAGDLLPTEVVDIAEMFLQYGAGKPTLRLMISSLFFSFYFPMRAANSLMYSVRKAYHLGAPRGIVSQTLKNLFYTLLLMLTVILTVLLMTVSNNILDYAVNNLGLPAFIADLWAMLRFPVIAVIGWLTLTVLYALAQDGRQNWRNLWPGTVAALCGWMLVSWLYTLYVNNIAHYSIVYGSIGTVIVLLIWLNFSSMVLIMGAELNGTLMSFRKGMPDKTSDAA